MENQPPITSESGEEPLESVREILRETQRKLAYYERFGPMLEEQMSTVVTKAAEVAKESEDSKAEMEREVARLRQESESLKAECEWRRSEAAAIIAQAHHDAAGILSKARGDVSTIVSSALAQLEQAQREVLQSTIGSAPPAEPTFPHEAVDPTPPSASHSEWNPVIESPDATATEPSVSHSEWNPVIETPGATATGTSSFDDQETSADRIVEVPASEPVPSLESTEAPSDDGVVTYLTVHSHLTQETLPQFGRTLEGLPGVRGTAVARLSDDAVELVVAHQRDTDLLARMRSIPGLDFRLVARGEGLVEIELQERHAPPLRA
jgi:hypothetical protein